MIIQLVAKRLTATDRIDAFHMEMFHGQCRLAGLKSRYHKPGDDLTNPLLYTCNGFRPPDVAMPSLNFIVSERVRSVLMDLPGLAFAPVVLEKVIELPYAAGDFSFYDRADIRRDLRRHGYETVFRRWKDRPELHAAVGARFEVVNSVDTELAGMYPEAKPVGLPDPRENDDELTPTPLSERMLKENSLVGTMCGTAFAPDAFRRIERFLDRDYFAVADVPID
jgi:hypothetical protein